MSTMTRWNFYQSGITGYTEILPRIPNPNGTPIEKSGKSTMVVSDLADGSQAIIIPPVKSIKDPVQFSWQFSSGIALGEKFDYLRDTATKVKFQAHERNIIFTGYVKDCNRKIIPWGQHWYEDVIITLQPQDD